jgi:NTP pyrophosphatase (non-canonical NTP hydrolase)
MTLERKIDYINQLNMDLFPQNSMLSLTAIKNLIGQAVEELGETHGAVRSYFGREHSPEKTATVDHVSEEAGDCISMLLVILALFGRDLNDSLDRVIPKLEEFKRKRQEEERIKHIMTRDERNKPVPVGSALKYKADLHQPFKYDVEDPINKPFTFPDKAVTPKKPAFFCGCDYPHEEGERCGPY